MKDNNATDCVDERLIESDRRRIRVVDCSSDAKNDRQRIRPVNFLSDADAAVNCSSDAKNDRRRICAEQCEKLSDHFGTAVDVTGARAARSE